MMWMRKNAWSHAFVCLLHYVWKKESWTMQLKTDFCQSKRFIVNKSKNKKKINLFSDILYMYKKAK